MPQIRNTKIQNMKNKITSSRLFDINDFKLEFPDTGNVLAKISLRGSNKYSFSIEENYTSNGILDMQLTLQNKQREKVIQTLQSPGQNKNFEVHNHKNIDKCIEELDIWLINLDEDLKHEDILDTMDNSLDIDEFEEKLNDKFPDESEKFTKDEQENLIAKINKLQERIEKLEKNENSENSIKALEESKLEVETYPKKTWWLKFYNRFHNVNKGVVLINDLRENIAKLIENMGS